MLRVANTVEGQILLPLPFQMLRANNKDSGFIDVVVFWCDCGDVIELQKFHLRGL